MSFVRLGTLVATLVVMLSARPAFAQTARPSTGGTITGKVVLESTGAAVHGAVVVVVGARRTANAGDDGAFVITNVAPGTYEVLAQREHFSAARQTVTVVAGQTATLEFKLSIEAIHEEVTVTASASGTSTTFESFNAITSLDAVELARNMGTTLADALANQPGIAKRSFGAGNARPVIRGFDGDRVLIMQDGVRTGDLSSQSGDHGVSIDPGGLQRLEVVKGPATLLYGSNAIGGVVNAITPQDAFRASPFAGLLGGVTFDVSSADGGVATNGSVQHGKGGWTMWAGGGARRTGDYDTPTGPVVNSGGTLQSGRGGFGYTGTSGFFSIGGSVEDSRFGIPFAGLFEGEPDAEIDIDALKKDVRVDVGAKNLVGSFADAVKLTFGYTDYAHNELEVEDGVESIGTALTNKTFTARGEVEQKRQGRLTGRMGAEMFRRDFSATGAEALAPAVIHTALAGFVYEEAALERVRLQFGARVERNAYSVDPRPADAPAEAPAVRDRSFTSVSGSLGLHKELGTRGAFVMNLTGASRAPALEELYNFGPHVGNLAFEVGNADLKVERTLGVDMSLRSRAARAQGELNLFAYNINNFVFLDFTGEEEDGLRVANYLQADSRFVGMELSGELQLHPMLHLHGGASYVRATLTGTDEFLPRIPPFSARVELEIPWNRITISPEVVFTAAQDNVFRDESRTAGSTVLGLGATYLFGTSHATHTVALKAYNLTNEDYRLHNSLLKDLASEMGRGVKLTYSIKFF
jgi:iron complex outermembrane receptor protein